MFHKPIWIIVTDQQFIELAKSLRQEMLAIAQRCVGLGTEAEDMVQDAMLKLWLKHNDLDTATITGFAQVVMRHMCVDAMRRSHQQPRLNIDEVAEQIEAEATLGEERSHQLLDAVDRLPGRQRTLLQMRYFMGKDVDDIAQITGSSADNVYKSLSRARMSLYRILAVVMVLACVVVVPFVVGESDTESPRITRQRQPVAMPSVEHDSTPPTPSTAATATIAHATQTGGQPAKESPQVLPTIKKDIVVYTVAEGEDIHLVASMTYQKEANGEYRVLSCDYVPVSDTGRKVAFVPDEKVRCHIDDETLSLGVDGTLTYQDADGNTVDQYVSLSQIISNK